MSSGLNLPDGLFMCCVCFALTPVEDAWRDDDEQAWDICSAECAAKTRHSSS